ncbi:MAG: LLM class F420-dependent oxidoreductase [Myxococcota bacterium]
MRIGLMSGAEGGAGSIGALIEEARGAEALGFDSFWLANIFGFDAITAQALVGHETERIQLGTAVVPSYPRHPVAIAQQALTTASASGGRFRLGIGLSHKIVIEDMFGMSYDKPAKHMREYLSVLAPLLRGEPAKFTGEQYRVNAGFAVPGAGPVPLLVAGLGPVMLRLTGELADGTITWMTGVKTLGSHISPRLRAAAEAAGRPEPQVVAGLPVELSDDPDGTRAHMDEVFAMYPSLPSYKAMLDREGVTRPSEIALVGNEVALREQLAGLASAGVTDLIAAVGRGKDGSGARTREFLARF